MKLTDKDIIEEKDSNEAQRKIQFKRKIVMKLTEEDGNEEGRQAVGEQTLGQSSVVSLQHVGNIVHINPS